MTAKYKVETKQVKLLRIIDGDTVEVQQKSGIISSHPKERIRLWGMDAPESSQTGGNESTKYLGKLIGGKSTIWLTRMTVDQYGRTVGVIHPGKDPKKNSYNFRMVQGGHAHCYMLSGPEKPKYEAAEAQAKDKKKGLWKRKKIQEPRLFRKDEKHKEENKRRVKTVIFIGAVIAALLVAIVTNYERFTG